MIHTFKAGVVQVDVEKGRIESNLEKIGGYLDFLAKKGVSLAVLPEMFTCSFDNERLKAHSKKTPEILGTLSSLASSHGMAIAGSLPEQENGHIFNTLVFIDNDGKLKGSYRKLHLFRLTEEHRHYTPGDRVVCVDTSLGRVGLMICYDLRFPELARSLFLKGADLIVVCAQWPEARKDHWETLIRARAIENQLFMICANRTGVEDGLVFPGLSMIVDPMGKSLTRGDREDGCVIGQIDPGLIQSARALIPCMTDRRRDIYG